MKEIDRSTATEVNGGLTPRQYEELPYTEPTASDPRIEIDYNPLPKPQ